MAIKIWRVSLPGAGDEYFDHMFSIVTTEDSVAYAVPEVDGKPLYYYTQERIDGIVEGMKAEDIPLPTTNLEWAKIATAGLDRFNVVALDDAKNDDYATVEQAIAQEADTALEAYERRTRGMMAEEEEPITAAAGACPPATQDIAINLKNRKNAIDTAMYGPLNPAEPNDEYWQALAGEWNVDAETAKQQRCGNCSVFIVTTDMKNCISEGLTGQTQSDEFDAIDSAGELGYCEAFDFKCASARTCRAWVAGGPIDDTKAGA